MLEKVIRILGAIPPEAVGLFGKLLDTILSSKSKVEAIRRATAAASSAASEDALKRALGRRKP